MGAENIYRILTDAGMTAQGACAVMGNMMAESGLKANIAQRGMTALSDEEYTRAADECFENFIDDKVGYGLCQWTFRSRKAALWNFAKRYGKSVGNESAQVKFCAEELEESYPGLWRALCREGNLQELTDRVCREYERPAVNNFTPRREAANKFFNAFAGEKEKERYWPPRMLAAGMSGPDVEAAQSLLRARGRDTGNDGIFSPAFRDCVVGFQTESGLAADGIIGEKTWSMLLMRR